MDERLVRERQEQINLHKEITKLISLLEQEFSGALRYETRQGKQYLYSINRRNGVRLAKSYGVRSAFTDQRLSEFGRKKSEITKQIKALRIQESQQAAVLRALGYKRMPRMTADILRKLRRHLSDAKPKVIGHHALYAYEALAEAIYDHKNGILDPKAKLVVSIAMECDPISILRDADQSFFEVHDGIFENDKGQLVEIISPETSKFPDWLLNSPSVETVIIDDRGYPLTIRVPTAPIWAASRLVVAKKEEESKFDHNKEYAEAEAAIKLIQDRFPGSLQSASIPEAIYNQLTRLGILEHAIKPV